MSPDVIGYVLAAVLTAAAALVTGRSNIRARQVANQARVTLDRMKVDGAAYDRAMTINRQITDELQAEIVRLNTQLADLRAQLTAEQARSRTLETDVHELESKVHELQRTVDRMKAILQRHDIPIPQGI